jgi:hypothetical protein
VWRQRGIRPCRVAGRCVRSAAVPGHGARSVERYGSHRATIDIAALRDSQRPCKGDRENRDSLAAGHCRRDQALAESAICRSVGVVGSNCFQCGSESARRSPAPSRRSSVLAESPESPECAVASRPALSQPIACRRPSSIEIQSAMLEKNDKQAASTESGSSSWG